MVWPERCRSICKKRTCSSYLNLMEIQLILFLLVGVTIISWLLRLRGIRTAYIWMAIIAVSLIVWGLVLLMPPQKETVFEYKNWFMLADKTISLKYSINPTNFAFLFLTIAYNLSFFLTAVSRLNIRSDLNYWTVQLLLTICAVLAFSASNLWSLLLAWTLLDVLNFLYQLGTNSDTIKDEIFRATLIKFAGSMLFVLSTVKTAGMNLNIDLDNLAVMPQHSFFLAALLHSGILPYPIKNKEGLITKKIIDHSFSIISFAVSFVLILKLTGLQISPLAAIPLKLFLFTILIIFAYKWMTTSSSVFNPINLLYVASCILTLFYISNAYISIFFFIASIMFGLLFSGLMTHYDRSLLLFPAIAILFISGLPLTLFSLGSHGFLSGGITLDSLFVSAAYILMLSGFFALLFNKKEKFDGLDTWYQMSYLSGLLIFLVSLLLIGFRNLSSISDEFNLWWFSVIIFGSSLMIFLFFLRKEKPKKAELQQKKQTTPTFFSLQWLFKIFVILVRRVQMVIVSVSQLLEGEGGVLWALVLLFLLISIINPK